MKYKTKEEKQKRLNEVIDSMMEDEGDEKESLQMALQTAQNLKEVAGTLEQMLKSCMDGKQANLCLAQCMALHADLDTNIIKGCLGLSALWDDEDEDDGYEDDEMPWDDEDDDAPDTFHERMESLCEKKMRDEDCGECALLFPIPCTKDASMKTTKDAFAKVDEEVNEWKDAVLSHMMLSAPLNTMKDHPAHAKLRVAEEGADIMTAIATAEERMGIDVDARADAQLHVNQHNKERGRW